MSNPLDGFKEGDLFRFSGRICTIEINAGKPMVISLSDGWSGLVEWQEGKQFTPERIEMPKTPAELFRFIRDMQYYEDWEDVAP